MRPLSTDSLDVEVGFRRRSACSSLTFTSIQLAGSPTILVWVSAKAPVSFSPCSTTLRCREPFGGRVHGRSLGDRPRHQYPVDLESEVEVQIPGVVTLYDEAWSFVPHVEPLS